MTLSPPAVLHWSLSGRSATCRLGGLPSTVDLDHPAAGLQVVRPGIGAADGLLGIDLGSDCRCSDVWCRGGDLTAVYESADGGRLRSTAMWRAAPTWLEAIPGVWCREAVVSAQTALLESLPHVAVGADIAGGTVTPVALRDGGLDVGPSQRDPHGCLVVGPGDTAVLFLVHPLDARGVEARAERDRVRITARLFPAAVEKGVLLRSRVIAAIGPADAAASGSWAADIAAAFAASPPVLTT